MTGRQRTLLLGIVVPIALAAVALAVDSIATEFHGRTAERIYLDLESPTHDELASSKIGRADAVLVVRPDGSVVLELPPPKLSWLTYLDRQTVDYQTYRIDIRIDPATGKRLVRMHHGSD